MILVVLALRNLKCRRLLKFIVFSKADTLLRHLVNLNIYIVLIIVGTYWLIIIFVLLFKEFHFFLLCFCCVNFYFLVLIGNKLML